LRLTRTFNNQSRWRSMPAGGLPSRPIIAAIVGVAAIDDGREAARFFQAGQPCVQLLLAEVAAIGRIGPVLGLLELRGPNNLVVQAKVGGHAQRKLTMGIGIAGAVGGHRQRTRPEHRGGRIGEVRAIRTATERHNH